MTKITFKAFKDCLCKADYILVMWDKKDKSQFGAIGGAVWCKVSPYVLNPDNRDIVELYALSEHGSINILNGAFCTFTMPMGSMVELDEDGLALVETKEYTYKLKLEQRRFVRFADVEDNELPVYGKKNNE